MILQLHLLCLMKNIKIKTSPFGMQLVVMLYELLIDAIDFPSLFICRIIGV